MAIWTLSADRLWSNIDGLGGVVGITDTIYLNGHVLTLEGANNSTYVCALIRAYDGAAASAGTIAIQNAISNIAANIYAGTVALLTMGASKTVNVSGTVTGGSVANAYGITMSASSAALTVGTAIGGGSTTGYGVYVNNGASLICTNANGGTGAGVRCFSGTATITSANGGSGVNSVSYGAYVNAGGTITVGTATGGSYLNNHGVYFGGGTGANAITLAVGGSAAGAHGVYIESNTGPTLAIGTAKGGSIVGAAGIGGFGNGPVTINAIDNTGVGQAIGSGTLKLAAGCILQYQNTSASPLKFYHPGDIAAATDVRYNIPRFTGATGGNLGSLQPLVVCED